MNPTIDYDNLVRQLAEPHRRQPVRLALLRAFVTRLKELHAQFYAYRRDTRIVVNLTGQVAVLEGWLRYRFDEPFAIKVVTYDDGLLPVGLEAEGETMLAAIGNTSDTWTSVALEGEMRRRFGDADFIVYVPASVDPALVTAELEKYRQALVTYKIVQQS